jgi:acetate kinase
VQILTVNAGSSSLKLSLIGDDDAVLASRELTAITDDGADATLREALRGELGAADAVAHRVVHGGSRFRDAVLVDDDVVDALTELVDLAPLHQPKSLAGLRAVGELLPDVPAIACFDTAFHQTIPPAAHTYALPAAWRDRWDIRRYGFHGLSHAWIARRSQALVGATPTRLVSCHLGSGASLCAIMNGRSIDTTMGFTPLDGLVMASRSGSVDPGLLLWLLERNAMTESEMGHALEQDSGLLGLGGTADMREILDRASRGDDRARLARDVYLHSLRAGIASMTAALGGLDVLAFTGGVGEHAAEIRRECAAGIAFLGVEVDGRVNREATADADLSGSGSQVTTLLLRAHEDLEMARQTRDLLNGPAAGR